MNFRALAASLGVLAVATAVSAEVSVTRDENQRFASLSVSTTVRNGRILHWFSETSGPDVLNRRGDRNGDFPPVALVLPASAGQDATPIVVWSASVGHELGLVWSMWSPAAGWSDTHELSVRDGADDLAPVLLVDGANVVHAAWWSDTPVPSVWYSAFEDGAWSAPRRLTAENRDCRNPRLVLVGRSLFASYEDWSFRPPRPASTFIKETFDP